MATAIMTSASAGRAARGAAPRPDPCRRLSRSDAGERQRLNPVFTKRTRTRDRPSRPGDPLAAERFAHHRQVALVRISRQLMLAHAPVPQTRTGGRGRCTPASESPRPGRRSGPARCGSRAPLSHRNACTMRRRIFGFAAGFARPVEAFAKALAASEPCIRAATGISAGVGTSPELRPKTPDTGSRPGVPLCRPSSHEIGASASAARRLGAEARARVAAVA